MIIRLDKAIIELTEETKKLAIGQTNLQTEVGSLSRTMSYAFENEAYRMLPKFLKDKYSIEIAERMVRADIGGREINFF